jgi:hypothetical protein
MVRCRSPGAQKIKYSLRACRKSGSWDLCIRLDYFDEGVGVILVERKGGPISDAANELGESQNASPVQDEITGICDSEPREELRRAHAGVCLASIEPQNELAGC